ncbi:MAG: amidohydrolase family protein [Planctomycetota bacterium]
MSDKLFFRRFTFFAMAWSLIGAPAAAPVAIAQDAPNAGRSPPALAPAAEVPLDGRDGRELALRLFRPDPSVKLRQTLVERARWPVVDIHTHFRVKTRQSVEARDAYIQLMDRNGIAVCVSLDGGWGEQFEDHAAHLWDRHRDRFVIFANIDWRGQGRESEPATWDCQRPDFPRLAAERLAAARQRGASGLKLFKDFGLGYRDATGGFLRVDDPRWDPIWEACGKLGMPVLMHTADPSAFFAPIDEKNERWEELHRRPDWSFHKGGFPSRAELLAARNRVIARHPGTIFIAAHMANDAEDLEELAGWLEKYPNLHVELASRISELGRQPYSARRFLIRYADRVLFGTDGPWPETRVRLYWRFLETDDENFAYSEKDFPPQGFWNIHGLFLPEETLKKLYRENAARLIPGVRERLEKWQIDRQ